MASNAHEFIHKLSDVPGDRPTSQDIAPGEIALNADSSEPGVFFLTNDGRTVKAGPTLVSSNVPVNSPERGESWFNLINGTLNVGTEEDAKKIWRKVSSPFLGGNRRVVFLAPEFDFASDSLGNDGQALPFRTLNRAVLELTKHLIQDSLTQGGSSSDRSKYTIFFAPSRLPVINSPGKSIKEFTTQFSSDPSYSPSSSELAQFNPEAGGVVFPPFFSLVGLDIQKCEIHPCYIPSYAHPALPVEHAGSDEPISAIIKPSLTSYFENISVRDKIRYIETNAVSSQENDIAILRSIRPHGVSRQERFNFSYSSNFDRQNRTFEEGEYLVDPIDSYRFRLIRLDSVKVEEESKFVSYSSLVPTGYHNKFKLTANSVGKSAHRLRAFKEASRKELSDFLTKVQKAFLNFFGGQVSPGSEILSALENLQNGNINPNDSSSIDLFSKVFIQSDYGMSGGEVDGDQLPYVASLRVIDSAISSVQSDPAAFEIYTTLINKKGQPEQRWWPLIEVAYNSINFNDRPQFLHQTPENLQLELLRSTPTENIRYYYRGQSNEQGESYGFSDPEKDFRHFGIKIVNSGYIYTDNVYTNAAIGKWGLNGGTVVDSDSESKFGALAIRSEGFRGIGTTGGAFPNLKGFRFSGVYTPLSLTRKQVEDTQNKKILTLGGRIVDIELSTADPEVQLVTLSCEFLPTYVLPYSLKPGTAVWVSSGNCTYRGFLACDGKPTVYTQSSGTLSGKTVLRIRLSDSTIPTDKEIISSLDIPYIRRFRDPRKKEDSSYRLVITNTNPDSIPPSPGNILRLDQSSPGITNPQVKPNVQFDPGEQGGWGRVFSVNDVDTVSSAFSPNFNYVVSDEEQDSKYLVTLSVSDYSRPWTQDCNLSTGNLVTEAYRNWYSAENNVWESLYYDAPIGDFNGPKKLPPSSAISPFVQSSHFEKQEAVAITYQGVYSSDSNIENYKEDSSYLRGYTTPDSEYQLQDFFDHDDGSESLGLVLKRDITADHTNLVSDINAEAEVQSEVNASNKRYQPAIVEFSVLSPRGITNPRQNTSVIKFIRGDVFEYMQVISLVGGRVQAIRLNSRNSFYPDPVLVEGAPPEWNSGELVHVCEFDDYPEAKAYDPNWSNSKKSIYRFFSVMGYSSEQMDNSLYPRFWGEREIGINLLPSSPDKEGYAKGTAEWAIEFNEPSTVVSSSHSWDSCGYISPSRGIRASRTNTLSKKLAYDCMAYSVWGGRIVVSGVNEKGEQISLGSPTQALTARKQDYSSSPTVSLFSQQLYEDQPYVEFPGQVVVYKTDDFSDRFDGNEASFTLTKGDFPLPPSHLTERSMFVQIGSITQRPGTDYWLSGDTIHFFRPPLPGTYCDVRVVTSEDYEKTLTVATMSLKEDIDSSRSIFTLESEDDIRLLDIDYDNLLVFLGGILQTPEYSYFLTRDSATKLTISFSEPLIEGTTPDIRAICTNTLWANRGVFPVAVYSLDGIGGLFDGSEVTFPLTYKGKQINSALVNTENTLVSIGGAVQIPDTSYLIRNGRITFTSAPDIGATSEIRVITNAPFIPCLDKRGRKESFLYWGPSVVMELEDELNKIRMGVN